jgi:transposase-like protein
MESVSPAVDHSSESSPPFVGSTRQELESLLPPQQTIVTALELAAGGQTADSPALVETKLPDSHNQAYKLRLQGMAVSDIAARFGVCRETIWRWCRAVADEFTRQLETTPAFNIIAEQFKRLRDLEEENRTAAAGAKSERAKAMFFAVALKALQAQNELLLDVGILDRAPDKLFSVVTNARPQPEKVPREHRSRQELISDLVDKLSRATHL